MKNLLKYFAFSAILVAFAVSCSPTPAEQGPEPVVASGGIDVAVSGIKDSSAVITLTPKGESLFYSYVLKQSATEEELDPLAVYKTNVKDAISSGLYKYSEASTTKVTVEELLPNTSYIVYTVAGSKTGVPSEVVAHKFTTTDVEAPDAVEGDATDTTVVIKFSEPVVAGTGKVTVNIYASLLWDGDPDKAYKKVDVDIADVKIDGNAVVVPVDIPTGAIYSVSYPEAAFKDKKGLGCPELKSSVTFDVEYNLVGEGLYGEIESVSYDMVDAFDVDNLPLGSTEATFSFLKDCPYPVVMSHPEKAGCQITYSHKGKSTTYELLPAQVKVVPQPSGDYKGVVTFPEAPVAGDMIKVKIPEGILLDIFMNVNKEWTGECTYAVPAP